MPQSVIVPERANPALGVAQVCDSPALSKQSNCLLMNPPRHAGEGHTAAHATTLDGMTLMTPDSVGNE